MAFHEESIPYKVLIVCYFAINEYMKNSRVTDLMA